jgi:hypothetical protein
MVYCLLELLLLECDFFTTFLVGFIKLCVHHDHSIQFVLVGVTGYVMRKITFASPWSVPQIGRSGVTIPSAEGRSKHSRNRTSASYFRAWVHWVILHWSTTKIQNSVPSSLVSFQISWPCTSSSTSTYPPWVAAHHCRISFSFYRTSTRRHRAASEPHYLTPWLTSTVRWG